VLQAVRDWLPTNEAADLAAQLPELLRGVYYEHWRPANTPVRERSKADFLARVDQAFKTDPLIFTPDAVSTVFAMLSDKISAGEIEDVRHALPADLRELWPVSSQAA
jgi:uncharacterized protein (DUF2267 family)